MDRTEITIAEYMQLKALAIQAGLVRCVECERWFRPEQLKPTELPRIKILAPCCDECRRYFEQGGI